MDTQVLLYHEPQVASLCGVHALNTLLQGYHFNEIHLGTIAQEFDAAERQLMMEGGVDSEDYLKYIGEESGNVAADGNFSIQVLAKALEVWSLKVLPLDHPDAGQAADQPHMESGFLCNLREHWFSIRPVQDQWYNFNSLFPAPEPLSTFYLAAYLGSLRAEGYTIFVVRGPLPASEAPSSASSASGVGGQGSAAPSALGAGGSAGGEQQGRWMTPQQVQEATQLAGQERQRAATRKVAEGAMARAAAGQTLTFSPGQQRNTRDTGVEEDDEEERQMRAAIAASLGGEAAMMLQPEDSLADMDDPDLAAAIAASLGDAQSGVMSSSANQQSAPGGEHFGGGIPSTSTDTMDPMLAAAIAASLQPQDSQDSKPQEDPTPQERVEVPEEPAAGGDGVVQLAVRTPDGKRLMRRFAQDTALKVVFQYVQDEGVSLVGYTLETSYPRKQLQCDSSTLEEMGITGQTMLNVVKKV